MNRLIQIKKANKEKKDSEIINLEKMKKDAEKFKKNKKKIKKRKVQIAKRKLKIV